VATLDRPRIEYRTPVDLVGDIERGMLRIPPFQRGFKWGSRDVIALFDSIVRGYPIGNLLLWQRSAPAQRLHVGPLTIETQAVDVAYWVVDGQQRITSLVGALAAPEDMADSRFRVHVDLADSTFHTLGVRQVAPPSWIPVTQLLDTARLLRWMRENAELLSDEHLSTADRVAKAIREFQIPTYVVSSADQAPLLEIFTRMNTGGKPLTPTEVFTALHTGVAGDRPFDLPGIGRVPAEMGFGSLDDRLVLRCILAWRGGDVFREDFAEEFESEADRQETFSGVAAALRDVVDFLRRDAGVPHSRLLPYSYVVPVLVRFVRLHGVPVGRAATLLRRWIWRGAVAGTRARAVGVGDVRDQVAVIDASDSLAAATQVLRLVPSFPDTAVELDRVHLNHAMTKINVLGLLSAEPRDLLTGEPIDLAGLLRDGSPLRMLVNDNSVPLTATLANRVVTHLGSGRKLRHALVEASPAVAASHLVDVDGQRLLAGGDLDAFLLHRADAVERTVKEHLDRMSEWGARDGRSIADAIRTVA
jgi:Protein of unknown function DUF262